MSVKATAVMTSYYGEGYFRERRVKAPEGVGREECRVASKNRPTHSQEHYSYRHIYRKSRHNFFGILAPRVFLETSYVL